MVPQERDNNYFYRTLLGSLEKHGGFNNAHLNRQVQRKLKISHCQSEM